MHVAAAGPLPHDGIADTGVDLAVYPSSKRCVVAAVGGINLPDVVGVVGGGGVGH